jgi:formylglycine-generating enzyme required for sulfatase activity
VARHGPATPTAIEPATFIPLDAAAAAPVRRLHAGRWLLLAFALLFALAMGFLLSARSLQVLVTAESPASVSVSGLALPFGDRYLLPPGEYRVRASAEGYHTMTQSVTVGAGESQSLALVLEPLPGLLSLRSNPAGARIAIDGEFVGETPIGEIEVAAGEHRLLAEAERHLPLEQTVQVTGRTVRQALSLALAPAWAEVAVDSEPGGAEILVDGEVAGTTPAQLELLQGERQLILRLGGYADWQETLAISAGERRDLGRLALQPAEARLQLESVPSGANVTLDGEFQGQTPLALAVSPGRKHRLALLKAGYRRHSDSVELPAGTSDNLTVTLQPQLGEVRFEISPPGAALRIDGQPRGRGSRVLSLPAFEHTVEVALEGHATVRRRVTPRPGLRQLVAVTLQSEQQARLSRLRPEITTAVGQTLLLFDPGQSELPDFTMGASRREPGRRSNEVLHPVSLRRIFYLQTTEVTNAQFRQFRAAHNSGQIGGNSLNRDHQPAVQVSWQQAAAFCNWLSRREGLPPFYRETDGIVTGFDPASTGYRLPTEAEWAWAARSTGPRLLKFAWGDTFPPTAPVENYADNSSAYVTGRILGGYTDGHVLSAPVGSFPPNGKGLHDLGGNVAEWVHDVYGIPADNGVAEVDPLGSQSGDNYVIRGASWAHSRISELRLSYRDYGQAGRDDVGFRLARYAE